MLALALATQAARADTPRTCVEVRLGDAQYYDCLNQELARAVPGHAPSSADTPYPATIPAPEGGEYNQAALRERLGSSYGHSAYPQRPTVRPGEPSLGTPR